jgi:hypothetical protein
MFPEHQLLTLGPYSRVYAFSNWFVISQISWAILGLVGLYWHPFSARGAQTILLVMAIGCFANWIKNRYFPLRRHGSALSDCCRAASTL